MHCERRLPLGDEKKTYGWEFVFLGANIDAVETAAHFGISQDHAINYHSDAVGTALNYAVVGDAIREMRACGKMKKNWRKRIDDDYRSRGDRR